MTFNPSDYEARQMRESLEVAEKLRTFVPLNGFGYGPPVRFDCPHGHSLKSYRVWDYEETLILQALPGGARKTGPVAKNGSLWQRSKSICEEPGCPEVVASIGSCERHGGPSEAVHHVRTSFTCEPCGWSDSFTHARLLHIYGMAVFLRMRRIPITGSTPSKR